MQKKETTLAYRCPACGQQVFSVVGVFALSGDMIKLKCECGQSELLLTYTQDNKVRVSVPCFLCNSPHQYVVSRDLFLSKELFALTCACSDAPICLTGQHDKVLAAAKEADAELAEHLAEAGLSDFSQLHPSHDAPAAEPEDADAVQFAFTSLCEENAFRCNCTEGGDYTYELMTDSVLFYCRGCGCTKMMPLGTTLAREALATCTEMDLRGRLVEG